MTTIEKTMIVTLHVKAQARYKTNEKGVKWERKKSYQDQIETNGEAVVGEITFHT